MVIDPGAATNFVETNSSSEKAQIWREHGDTRSTQPIHCTHMWKRSADRDVDLVKLMVATKQSHETLYALILGNRETI